MSFTPSCNRPRDAGSSVSKLSDTQQTNEASTESYYTSICFGRHSYVFMLLYMSRQFVSVCRCLLAVACFMLALHCRGQPALFCQPTPVCMVVRLHSVQYCHTSLCWSNQYALYTLFVCVSEHVQSFSCF